MDMQFDITYGIDKEIARVKETLQKLDWYAEQGYPSDFAKLPAGISKASNSEEISNAVLAEFDEQQYRNAAEMIEREKPVLIQRLDPLNHSDFRWCDTCTIVLTRYGSNGSYDAGSCKMLVNIGTVPKERLVGIIAHEIVHISIQHLIDLYNVRHWYKERLVDLIIKKCFPDLQMMQFIDEDVSLVDRAFEAHFPNIELISREIGR